MPAAFSATGLGYGFTDGVGVTALNGPAELVLSYGVDNPVLRYTVLPSTPGTFLTPVDLEGSQILIPSINGVVLGDEGETLIGRVTWSGGTTDVLVLHISPSEEYLFRLGGAPLPVPTTVAEANAFFSSITSAVVPTGAFGPGVDIPLSSLSDNWEEVDVSQTTTYEIGGFSFSDVDGNGVVGLAATEVALRFAASAVSMTYTVEGTDNDTGFPGGGVSQVALGFDQPPLGVLLNGQPIQPAEGELEVLTARITTTTGTHDVLFVDDLAAGRTHMVLLGGAPLPASSDPASVQAFFQSITAIDPIPSGTSNAAGQPIALSGIPGIVIEQGGGPEETPNGTEGVVIFQGYTLVDDGDQVSDFAPATLQIAMPVDNAPFTYSIIGYDDALPLIDLLGPNEPYAVLVNGLAMVGDMDVTIGRLTNLDGTYHDVMFIWQDSGYHLFQIGGNAGEITFNSVAEADAFSNSFEGLGQQGPIPGGQPFAPGVQFAFTDSDFASIDRDLQVIEGGSFGRGAGGANYGRGSGAVGSVTVVNEGELVFAPNQGDGPFVNVGRDGGAGVMTVAGADSVIRLDAGGGTTGPLSEGGNGEGAAINIGRNGGSGMMRVLDGALFEVVDTNGTSQGANGAEVVNVGRGTGAQGLVYLADGDFRLSGTGAQMNVGTQLGAGAVEMEGDSILRIQSTSTGDLARLRIGVDGGQGAFLIDEGFAIVQAAAQGNAEVTIGQASGTTGTPGGQMAIVGNGPNAQGDWTEGLLVVGHTDSPLVSLNVGDGGVGQLAVNGGFLDVVNNGTTTDDDFNEIDLPGDGGAAHVRVGSEGTGTLNVQANASMFVMATDQASLVVGSLAGGFGTMLVDASEVLVESETDRALLEIGDLGATGTLTLRNGAELELAGQPGQIAVGLNGGTGNLILTGAGTRLFGATEADFGFNTGSAYLTIQNGASLELTGRAGQADARLTFGAGNPGVVSAVVEGADSRIQVTGLDASVDVGVGAGANAALRISAGGSLTVTGTDAAQPGGTVVSLLQIAQGGATGLVALTGAGTALSVAGGPVGGVIEIARTGTDTTGVLHVASGADVTAGQIRAGGADVDVGALVLAGGNVTATSGFTLDANSVIAGQGIVAGALNVTAGGIVAAGDTYDTATGVFAQGLGQLTVQGNVTLAGATSQFQFGAGGADLLEVTGSVNLSGGSIAIDYQGTYSPAMGLVEQMLVRASGGITLDGTALTHDMGDAPNLASGLELRAGGTELWFHHGPATVNLTGTVDIREAVEGAVNAAGTVVRFTAADSTVLETTTDAEGAFSFEIGLGTAGTLEVLRTYATDAPALDKALTVNDVIRLFNLVAGAVPAGNFDANDIIAADYNRDGAANVTDAIDLFRFIAGQPGSSGPEYIFIDNAADQSSVDFATVPLSAPISIAALNADMSLSLTGILSGDLNGHV